MSTTSTTPEIAKYYKCAEERVIGFSGERNTLEIMRNIERKTENAVIEMYHGHKGEGGRRTSTANLGEQVSIELSRDTKSKCAESKLSELEKYSGCEATGIRSSSEERTSSEFGAALVSLMSSGANEFEKKVGRPMTYSEMRSMFG